MRQVIPVLWILLLVWVCWPSGLYGNELKSKRKELDYILKVPNNEDKEGLEDIENKWIKKEEEGREGKKAEHEEKNKIEDNKPDIWTRIKNVFGERYYVGVLIGLGVLITVSCVLHALLTKLVFDKYRSSNDQHKEENQKFTNENKRQLLSAFSGKSSKKDVQDSTTLPMFNNEKYNTPHSKYRIDDLDSDTDDSRSPVIHMSNQRRVSAKSLPSLSPNMSPKRESREATKRITSPSRLNPIDSRIKKSLPLPKREIVPLLPKPSNRSPQRAGGAHRITSPPRQNGKPSIVTPSNNSYVNSRTTKTWSSPKKESVNLSHKTSNRSPQRGDQGAINKITSQPRRNVNISAERSTNNSYIGSREIHQPLVTKSANRSPKQEHKEAAKRIMSPPRQNGIRSTVKSSFAFERTPQSHKWDQPQHVLRKPLIHHNDTRINKMSISPNKSYISQDNLQRQYSQTRTVGYMQRKSLPIAAYVKDLKVDSTVDRRTSVSPSIYNDKTSASYASYGQPIIDQLNFENSCDRGRTTKRDIFRSSPIPENSYPPPPYSSRHGQIGQHSSLSRPQSVPTCTGVPRSPILKSTPASFCQKAIRVKPVDFKPKTISTTPSPRRTQNMGAFSEKVNRSVSHTSTSGSPIKEQPLSKKQQKPSFSSYILHTDSNYLPRKHNLKHRNVSSVKQSDVASSNFTDGVRHGAKLKPVSNDSSDKLNASNEPTNVLHSIKMGTKLKSVNDRVMSPPKIDHHSILTENIKSPKLKSVHARKRPERRDEVKMTDLLANVKLKPVTANKVAKDRIAETEAITRRQRAQSNVIDLPVNLLQELGGSLREKNPTIVRKNFGKDLDWQNQQRPRTSKPQLLTRSDREKLVEAGRRMTLNQIKKKTQID